MRASLTPSEMMTESVSGVRLVRILRLGIECQQSSMEAEMPLSGDAFHRLVLAQLYELQL